MDAKVSHHEREAQVDILDAQFAYPFCAVPEHYFESPGRVTLVINKLRDANVVSSLGPTEFEILSPYRGNNFKCGQ